MPVWFSIKKNKHFFDGSKHIFLAIQTSRYLSVDLFQVVNPVIEHSAFCAHPENLLLAMIVESENTVASLDIREF